MDAIDEVQKLLPSLSRGEKAQLLKWVVQDLADDFPGIDSTPGVCGGDPCIVRTRIPVWLLVDLHRQGISDSELLATYPSLRAEDLANAWAYARIHSAEIDRQIREQSEA